MTPRTLVVAAALLAAAAAHGGAFEEIRELNRDMAVAVWTGDAVWFEQNLADEYVLITPTGETRTKRDVIRELTTSGLRMDAYEPLDVHVRIYGGAAVVTGRAVQRFTVGGVRYARDIRYTDVYVKRKSTWQLVSGHNSAIVKR